MAIYSYTNSGITFNKLDSNPNPQKKIPGKIVFTENDFEYAEEDGIKPVVNAVEIDWNSAELDLSDSSIMDDVGADQNGKKTINTTGDLLKLIEIMAKNIAKLQVLPTVTVTGGLGTRTFTPSKFQQTVEATTNPSNKEDGITWGILNTTPRDGQFSFAQNSVVLNTTGGAVDVYAITDQYADVTPTNGTLIIGHEITGQTDDFGWADAYISFTKGADKLLRYNGTLTASYTASGMYHNILLAFNQTIAGSSYASNPGIQILDDIAPISVWEHDITTFNGTASSYISQYSSEIKRPTSQQIVDDPYTYTYLQYGDQEFGRPASGDQKKVILCNSSFSQKRITLRACAQYANDSTVQITIPGKLGTQPAEVKILNNNDNEIVSAIETTDQEIILKGVITNAGQVSDTSIHWTCDNRNIILNATDTFSGTQIRCTANRNAQMSGKVTATASNRISKTISITLNKQHSLTISLLNEADTTLSDHETVTLEAFNNDSAYATYWSFLNSEDSSYADLITVQGSSTEYGDKLRGDKVSLQSLNDFTHLDNTTTTLTAGTLSLTGDINNGIVTLADSTASANVNVAQATPAKKTETLINRTVTLQIKNEDVTTIGGVATSTDAGTGTVAFTLIGESRESDISSITSYNYTIISGNSSLISVSRSSGVFTITGQGNSTGSQQQVTVRLSATWSSDNQNKSQQVDVTVNVPADPVVQTTYYWYVGTTVPTNPTNNLENTGNNQWTSLGTSLPTSSIQVAKVDNTYNYNTWYIAAPSAANFTLYNATNVASDEAGWNKSTFNVGSIEYTLWTCKAQSYQAAEYLHK